MGETRNTGRKGRPLGPYPRRETLRLQWAVETERDACREEALAWCSHKTEPDKPCVACAIAAAIDARRSVVPGHHKKCPLSQPTPAPLLGVPDEAKCCCRVPVEVRPARPVKRATRKKGGECG